MGLDPEGWDANRKKIHRLWREESLKGASPQEKAPSPRDLDLPGRPP